MKVRSIRFKISVLYTVILAIILIIYSTVLYLSLSYLLYEDIDNDLTFKAQEIESTILAYSDILGKDDQSFSFAVKRVIGLEEEHPEQEKINEFETRWLRKRDKLDLENDYILFFSEKGEVSANSKNIPADLVCYLVKNSRGPLVKTIFFKNIRFFQQRLRCINYVFFYNERGPFFIQVASSIKPIIGILRNRQYAIMISIFVITGASIFIGRFFVNRILYPVREVVSLARQITYKDLSSRVKLKHVDEEMEYLVDAFNEMITRLEKSFQHIVEFSSHVAHELKTPLTIMRGESELAQEKEGLSEESRQLILSNMEEITRMIKTVEDLLLLTKLEYRPEVFKFEKTDLVFFLHEIFEQAKLLASKKNIFVSFNVFSSPVMISADKIHLRRLFYNLIHNAIKFTAEGGKVEISANRDAAKVYVLISDTGIGITDDDLPRIFDKFFHVNRTDQDLESGNGLGLNIALYIAKIHQGEIDVKSKFREGAVFTVILPLA